MEDSAIIDLLFERSEEAVGELYVRYGALCRRIAMNILGDERDAEECVSDSLLALWNAVPPLRPDPLGSYLCRIVRNQALKRRRDNGAEKRRSSYDLALEELADCLPDRETPEDALQARETARYMNAFLETLDPESRALFIRRYWQGDSVQNLADFLGTGRHNVTVRLSRIREKLKKYLIKQGVSL